jgi:hypothetical protein
MLSLQIVGRFPLVDVPLGFVRVVIEVPFAKDVVSPVDAASQTVRLIELLLIPRENVPDSIGLLIKVVGQDEGLLYAWIVTTVTHWTRIVIAVEDAVHIYLFIF